MDVSSLSKRKVKGSRPTFVLFLAAAVVFSILCPRKGGSVFETSSFAQVPPSSPETPAQENTPSHDPADIPPEGMVFSFIQGFPESQTGRWKRGNNIQGKWNGKGFQFEDSVAGAADVFLSDQTQVGGKFRPAVWLSVTPGEESYLIFSHVPPGRRLRLFYALPDYVFQVPRKEPLSFLQIEVLVGKKKVLEAQTNTKNWKEKSVDLTLPYLLQKDYEITIRARSLNPEALYVVLYGYVQ